MSNKSTTADPSSNGIEVHLVVWQFVRLMVRFEEMVAANSSQEIKDIFNLWEDVWTELDARLLDLGKGDPLEFSSLMMDQEIVLKDVRLGQIRILIDVLQSVIRDISMELKSSEDEERVDDLSFERDELQNKIHELGNFLRA